MEDNNRMVVAGRDVEIYILKQDAKDIDKLVGESLAAT